MMNEEPTETDIRCAVLESLTKEMAMSYFAEAVQRHAVVLLVNEMPNLPPISITLKMLIERQVKAEIGQIMLNME